MLVLCNIILLVLEYFCSVLMYHVYLEKSLMSLQISNSGNVFSMLRLLLLDSIANTKRRYPLFADILLNSRQSEMDNIINKLHSALSIQICKMIVIYKILLKL